MSALSEGRAGSFAGRPRGSLSQHEMTMAMRLRSQGRGVQSIATYLGRSMEDVSRLLASPQEAVVAPEKPEPRPVRRAGAMSKDEAFKRMWNAGVTNDVIMSGLGISKSSVTQMRQRLGLAPRVSPHRT